MNVKLFAIASLALSFAVAAGCVVQPNDTLPPPGGQGGSGSGSGPASSASTSGSGVVHHDSPARAYFVASVFPQISSGAQPCISCHATGMASAPMFLDQDAEKAYDKIDAFPGLITLPENSLLLQHGLHTGPAMTTPQKDATTTWLNMEAQERGLGAAGPSGSSASSSSSGGPTKPTDLPSALAAFANCMDPNDWNNNGLKGIASVQTNNNQGPCNSCHNAGDYGNYLNAADALLTFNKQKEFPFIKRWVSGTYDMNGNFIGLKAVPREYLKGQEAALCDPAKEACHPKYTMTAALKTGIDTFIANTLDKMQKNLCP